MAAACVVVAGTFGWTSGCGGEKDDLPSVKTGVARQGVLASSGAAAAAVEALTPLTCAARTAKVGDAGTDGALNTLDLQSGPTDGGGAAMDGTASALLTSSAASGSVVGDAGAAILAPPPVSRFVTDGVRVRPEWTNGTTPPVDLELPDQATGRFSLREKSKGMAVQVALAGAQSSAAEASGSHLVYRSAHPSGGDVVHRVGPHGTEDYVTVKTKGATPEIVYEVSLEGVAGLRQVDAVVEFLDAEAVPRLRMFAPAVLGANCERVAPKVSVEGCATTAELATVVAPGATTCKVHVSWEDSKVTYPVIVDPSWSSTGAMVEPVEYPAYVSVPVQVPNSIDGGVAFQKDDVIVAGGTTRPVGGGPYGEPTATTQVYRWATGVWQSLAPIPPQTAPFSPAIDGGRHFHTLNLVGTSRTKAIAVGGASGSGAGYVGFSNTPVYDMRDNTWSVPASGLQQVRVSHRTVSMAEVIPTDGRVVTTGGHSPPADYVEAFDPTNNTWGCIARLRETRLHHVAVPLLSGKILVTTGWNPSNGLFTNTTEFVRTVSVTPVACNIADLADVGNVANQATAWSAAVREPTAGNVLLIGGEVAPSSAPVATTQVFKASNGTWSAGPNLPSVRTAAGASLLGTGGRVFFGGGWDGATTPSTTFTWEYGKWKTDPANNLWVSAPLLQANQGHSVPLVASGWGHQVLVAGGTMPGPAPATASEKLDFCDQGCNDGNDCNVDVCTASGCNSSTLKPNGTPAPDGVYCNGTETCDGFGNRLPGVPPSPAGTDPCARGACQEGPTGPLFNVAAGISCDDGNPCKVNKTCNGAGSCIGTNAAYGTACKDNDDPCDGTGVCNGVGGCGSPGGFALDAGVTGPCTETVCVSNVGLKLQPKASPPAGCTGVVPPAAPDTTVPTDIADLAAGLLARQPGVAPGTLSDPAKNAIVSGRVLDNTYAPLGSATVVVLGHSEYGSTQTLSDGRFSLVVNGGTTHVLSITSPDRLEVQRHITVGWQDWNVLDEVIMTPKTAPGALPTFSLPVPANTYLRVPAAGAQAPTDGQGARDAIVILAPGTTVSSPSGLTGPFAIGFDEYTMDPRGRARMPGDLPPASAYTYALDLRLASTVGGALNWQSSDVVFSGGSQAPMFYVRNFPNMQAGKIAPAGWYDRTSGTWVASNLSQNGASLGRVVTIVSGCSGTTGTAQLDTDGNGIADNCAPPSCATTIPSGERDQLCAAGYGTVIDAGSGAASLWRVPMSHFTPWDINWGRMPPAGAKEPKPDKPPTSPPNSPTPDPCVGSIIGCQNQSLGEEIPIVGTSYRLRYQSDRQAGRLATINVPITGATVPVPTPARIDVVVRVADNLIKQSVLPPFAPNQEVTVVWDRRDLDGRLITGSIPARVETGNVYDSVASRYQDTSEFGYSGDGGSITGDRTTGELTLWRFDMVKVEGMDARAWGLGGLSLSDRHIYDRYARILYRGDGSIRRMGDEGDSTISMLPRPTPSPAMSPVDVAVTSDGSVYVADRQSGTSGSRIRRVDATSTTPIAGCYDTGVPSCTPNEPDGDAYTPAGPPTTCVTPPCPITPGGNCTMAGTVVGGTKATDQYLSPSALAAAPDGSLFYLSQNHRVRRLFKSGADWYVETVAGTGFSNTGCTGVCDGSLGRQLRVLNTSSIAIGSDGALYIGHADGYVRRLVQDKYQAAGNWVCGHAPWISTTIVGGGTTPLAPNTPDGTQGRNLNSLSYAISALATAPDGTVFFSAYSTNSTLYALEPSGTIRKIAGGNASGPPADGDGALATAAYLGEVTGLALLQGNLYFTDRTTHKVRVVDPLGLVHAMTAPGATANPTPPPDIPAQKGTVNFPLGLAVGPQGNIYVASDGDDLLRVIRPPALPGCTDAVVTMCLPSEDGKDVYGFDDTGRHRWTKATLGGAKKVEFTYHATNTGQVTSITDITGKQTAVATTGSPVSSVVFTAPFGQTTTLTVNTGTGYTTQVRHVRTAPSSFEDYVLSYGSGGLLTSFRRPGNGVGTAFQYDALGRLTYDKDPTMAVGAATTLDMRYLAGGREVTLTTADLHKYRGRFESLASGGEQSSMTDPAGVVRTTTVDLRGATTTIELDGGVVTRVEPGDAGTRFGMLAPENTVETTTVTANLHQPALDRSVSTSNAATLSNPNDVFSTTTETMSVVRGGKINGVAQSNVTWPTSTTVVAGVVTSMTTAPAVGGWDARSVERKLDAKQRLQSIRAVNYPSTPGMTTTFNYTDAVCANPPTGTTSCGGRLSSIVVTSPGETTRTTTMAYAYGGTSSADPGWLSAAVDPEGYRTTFGAWNGSALTASGRDGLGRATKITRTRDTFAPSFVTDLTYDGNGNVNGVTPPGKTLHTLISNAVDRLTDYQPPQGTPPLATKNTTYTYNQERAVVAQFEPWDATTRQLLFGRDMYGRMGTRVDPIAGTTVTWSYDLGRVSQLALTGGNGAVTVAEAFAGRLPIQTTYTGGVAAALLRTYDHEMRVTKLRVRQTTPSQIDYPVASTYAADGLLAAVALRNVGDTADLAKVTFTTRDGIGRGKTVTVTRGDGSTGLSETATFNGFGEPMTTKVCTGGSGITCTGGTTYYEVTGATRDKLGRLTALTETTTAIPGGSGATTVTWGYTYDEAGRLKTVAKTGATTTTYTYDANGNRTGASGGETITSVVIDGQDRLTQQTKNGVQTTYTYRNNGSMWTSTSPTAAWSFLYDLQGNLHTATKSGASLAYLVDGLNRRVGKTGTGATHTAKYVYDGQLRVAAELDATTNAVTHVYAYGEKATTPELVYEPATTKTYRIVSDVRGSVRLVLEVPATAGGGAPVVRQRIDYDAWGVASEWVNLTGDASFKRVSLGYAGGLWDRDTGLVRFGARDYEPATGRWTGKDPIRFDGGVNLYVYAGDDPVNRVDATGLYTNGRIEPLPTGSDWPPPGPEGGDTPCPEPEDTDTPAAWGCPSTGTGSGICNPDLSTSCTFQCAGQPAYKKKVSRLWQRPGFACEYRGQSVNPAETCPDLG